MGLSGLVVQASALREAARSLGAIVKQAAEGLGVDRHLYALKCIWHETASAEAPLPDLFADRGWEVSATSSCHQGQTAVARESRGSNHSFWMCAQALNHTTISTSNCGNPVRPAVREPHIVT